MSQLKPERRSSRDKIEFSRVVARKLVVTANAYAKAGRVFLIPKNIEQAAVLMRRMHKRYDAGHFRHTEDELLAEQDVARFLVDKHCELNGSTPPPTTWDKF